MKKKVFISDKMQKDYSYYLTEPIGRNFHPDFVPELTPGEMLELGVFGGKYMTDCKKEFPASWYKQAKLSPIRRSKDLNFFGVNASQSLLVWRKKGWINPDDPRGWFQWYCRYYVHQEWVHESPTDDPPNPQKQIVHRLFQEHNNYC